MEADLDLPPLPILGSPRISPFCSMTLCDACSTENKTKYHTFSSIWMLSSYFQAAQHPSLPVIMETTARLCPFRGWETTRLWSLEVMNLQISDSLHQVTLVKVSFWVANSKIMVEWGDKRQNQHNYIKKPQELGKEYCLPASVAEMLLETGFWNSGPAISLLILFKIQVDKKRRGSGNIING